MMNINSYSTHSTTEHVAADHNTEHVGPVWDNVEHVDVHMAGIKTHIRNVFFNELLVFIKI